jgi:hypothetical protein
MNSKGKEDGAGGGVDKFLPHLRHPAAASAAAAATAAACVAQPPLGLALGLLARCWAVARSGSAGGQVHYEQTVRGGGGDLDRIGAAAALLMALQTAGTA